MMTTVQTTVVERNGKEFRVTTYSNGTSVVIEKEMADWNAEVLTATVTLGKKEFQTPSFEGKSHEQVAEELVDMYLEGDVDAIETFLANWKQVAEQYYLELKVEYTTLTGSNCPYKNYDARMEFKETHGKGVYDLMQSGYFEEKLAKMLDKEVETKRKNLMTRIAKKVGEVVTANLYIGVNGDINGTVEGTKGTAKITTVLAEGMVQRLHARVLVS